MHGPADSNGKSSPPGLRGPDAQGSRPWGRRLLATLIDGTPTFVCLVLLTPAALAMLVAAYEQTFGFGIYDPASGGDPVVATTVARALRPTGVLFTALAVWTLLQALAALAMEATLGKRLAGLRIAAPDGQAPDRPKLLLRATLPHLFSVAWLGATLLLHSLGHALAACTVIAAALELALGLRFVDVCLALRGGPSLYDKITNTSVVRRE